MNKSVLAAFVLTGAVSAFAQGTVVFNNRVATRLVTRIYAPLAGNPTFYQAGNSSLDTPAGTALETAMAPLRFTSS